MGCLKNQLEPAFIEFLILSNSNVYSLLYLQLRQQNASIWIKQNIRYVAWGLWNVKKNQTKLNLNNGKQADTIINIIVGAT